MRYFVIFYIMCGVSPAFSADCESYNADARRASSSNPDDEYIISTYGPICVLRDSDRQQPDYYTASEALCNSLPGSLKWQKDQGSGHNTCLFNPPPDADADSSSSSTVEGTDPNSCEYANDNACDEPGLCSAGTDTNDCRITDNNTEQNNTPLTNRQTPPVSDQWFGEFKVCNEHYEKAWLAIAYRKRNYSKFTVKGWYGIEPGQCTGNFRSRIGNIYIYAYSGTYSWGGSQQLCIRNQRFEYLAEGGSCTERSVGFEKYQLDSNGRTITLR